MKIIYYGFHADYLSIVGAALHIGIIKEDFNPDMEVLHRLPYCHPGLIKPDGVLHFIGLDEMYHEIYIMGCRKHFHIIRKVQTHVQQIFHIGDGLYYVNATKWEGIPLRLGKRLYRWRMTRKWGERLIVNGIRRVFPYLVKQVHEVKSRLTEDEK
ncbi:MAG: DUF3189 family protein [Clostridia bacterium]